MSLLKKLAKKTGQALQENWDTVKEIRREISYDIKELSSHLTPAAKQMTKPSQVPNAAAPPDPLAQQKALLAEMDRAIHTAYYKEGGFRFFGCCFARYVKVNLPNEQDPASMWAAGYNTCLNPMVQIQAVLDQKLKKLQTNSGMGPLVLKNQGLWTQMSRFAAKVQAEGLHQWENQSTAAYRQALQRYCNDLEHQLLEPYCPPENNGQ